MIILYLMVSVGVGLAIVKHNRESKDPKISLIVGLLTIFGWPVVAGYLLIDSWGK